MAQAVFGGWGEVDSANSDWGYHHTAGGKTKPISMAEIVKSILSTCAPTIRVSHCSAFRGKLMPGCCKADSDQLVNLGARTSNAGPDLGLGR